MLPTFQPVISSVSAGVNVATSGILKCPRATVIAGLLRYKCHDLAASHVTVKPSACYVLSG
jgi:hypothetical protein